MAKIKLDSDVFYIINLLKKIDKTYYVIYDTQRKKYEVHSSAERNSYCFTVPYVELDSRTIDYCLKTRKENRDRLLKELEEHNNMLERQGINHTLSNAKDACSEILKRSKYVS